MSPRNILFFCLSITLTASDKMQRSPRIISFNSFSDGIGVNLDFTIPFLKIPLKENVNLHSEGPLSLPKINFDPKSLAFGGALVALTSLLASVFSKGIILHNNRYSRQDDNYMSDALLEIASTIMSSGQSCPARIACWTGRATNIRRLTTLKKITRNKLLTSMFNTTEFANAYSIGRAGGDCETFTPCLLNEYQFLQLINNISSYKNTFIPRMLTRHNKYK